MINLNLKNSGGGGNPQGTYKVVPLSAPDALIIPDATSGRANIIVKHPSDTNKVVILCVEGTLLEAYTYDFTTKDVVTLTKSGVSVANISGAEEPEAVLVGSTIYLYAKSSSGSNLVYTYTISGTTITQGTNLDISAEITLSENHYSSFATDGTDLYFIVHNSSGNTLKKYDISGTSWSTLSAPSEIFHNDSAYASLFSKGTAKIFFIGGRISGANIMTLLEYDIAGDSWSIVNSFGIGSSPTLPKIYCDFYDANSPVYIASNLSGLYEVDTTTGKVTFIGGEISIANHTSFSASSGSANISQRGFFHNTASKKLMLHTNEDQVLFDASDFINGDQLSVSGSGTYVGADTNSDLESDNIFHRNNQFIQIDGGDWIPIVDNRSPVGQQNYRIEFSTSLKVRNGMLLANSGSSSIFNNAHYYEE